MQMLSDDDRNLSEMTPEELDAAWDLWFDLAQATNDHDPAYEHGVFAGTSLIPPAPSADVISYPPVRLPAIRGNG
jgi:hypothetical protein